MRRFFLKLSILLPIIVVGVIIVVAFFNGRNTSMGDDAKKSVYVPSESEGLLKKSESLFSRLLSYERQEIQVKTIADLNTKYPAYRFSLPYSEDSQTFSHVEDIRCVGINEKYLDSLNDQDLKTFYYNSRLPQLFKLQEKGMGNKLFKMDIGYKVGTDTLQIKSIHLIKSMFKVALDKIRWKSTVYGQDNPLYPNDKTIFLSWGKAVLPIRIDAETNNLNLICQRDSNSFLVSGNNSIELPKNGYYDYYKYYKNSCPRLILNIGNNKSVRLKICLKQVNDNLMVFYEYQTPDDMNVTANVYAGNKRMVLHDLQPAGAIDDSSAFVDGMRIVINDDKEKYAEFVLTKQNPICVLSSEIKTNKGYDRYIINDSYTDVFTQQLLRGINSALSYYEYNEDVFLSIDPILSHEMENEMRLYINDLKRSFAERGYRNAVWDMSLTVMDIETGNVLAAPYVSDRVDKLSGVLKYAQRNTALQRRPIGSAFKPLLALATVLTNKYLLELDTRGKYSKGDDGYCNFYGTKVGEWAKEYPAHWNGCDFKTFLSRSDDVYPAALVALCMNSNDNPAENLSIRQSLKPYPEKSIFKDGYKNILTIKIPEEDNVALIRDYDLFKILDILYDINDYGDYERSKDSSRIAEMYMWRNLKSDMRDSLVKDWAIDVVTPDYTNMNYHRTLQKKHSTFHGEWRPWILGQGGNDWSCIKLAEAYSRLISKKKVCASFVVGASRNEPLDTLLSSHQYVGNESERDLSYINAAWNGFLDKFADAQKEGSLLSPMYNVVNNIDDNLVLFSKTGTPNLYERTEFPVIEGKHQHLDVAYYCFGLMTKDSYNKVKAGKQPKGIVCVIRITRKLAKEESGNGLWSFHARDFFSNNLERLKKFYEMTKIYY